MPAERGPSGTGHDTAASERVLNRVLLCPHRKDCLDNGCTGCCEQDPPLCRDGSNVTHRPPRVTEAAPATYKPCSDGTLHGNHEWLDGVVRHYCPGIPYDRADPPVAVPGPASVPADPVVSPADTLRRELTAYLPDGFRDEDGVWHDGPVLQDALAALAALLAVGERDKADRQRLTGPTRVLADVDRILRKEEDAETAVVIALARLNAWLQTGDADDA